MTNIHNTEEEKLREEFYMKFNNGESSAVIETMSYKDVTIRLDWIADFWLSHFKQRMEAIEEEMKKLYIKDNVETHHDWYNEAVDDSLTIINKYKQ